MRITDAVLFVNSVLACLSLATLPALARCSDIEPPASDVVFREWRERPDMLDARAPAGLRIIQITANPNVESHQLYPECPMFTPDSQKFVFLRSSGSKPLRGYWLCDLGDDYALRKLVGNEEGAIGMVMSPDGRWAYYIVSRMLRPEQDILVKRVSLDDYHREVLFTYDGAIPGKSHKLSLMKGPTSISSDGRYLCGWAFLGDGKQANAPFGMFVFDIEARSTRLVFQAEEFCNMHLQYCHSPDPLQSHDILVQTQPRRGG